MTEFFARLFVLILIAFAMVCFVQSLRNTTPHAVRPGLFMCFMIAGTLAVVVGIIAGV